MANYDFLDAYSSVQTAASSTVGGAERPIVIVPDAITINPPSVSGTVGASIIGLAPVSVDGLQGASISGTVVVSGLQGASVSGSVGVEGTVPVTLSGNPSISGTVLVGGTVTQAQSGAVRTSIVGVPSISGTILVGNTPQASIHGTVAIFPSSIIEGYASTVNVSVTTLVGAAGTGLKNYITDVFIANTGASDTLVTFRSGGGASVLGYTIAPSGGGSNLPGLTTPIRTLANQTFDFQATTATSVLYATVKGYKAP